MAKALLGHVGLAPDARLLDEVRRLRRRVRELEDELARVRAVNESLLGSVTVEADDLLALSQEPALT